MKRILLFMISILFAATLAACGKSDTADNTADMNNYAQEDNSDKSEAASYKMITMEDAKSIFEAEGDYVILDVRRADEFAEGHIPGAINIANEDIASDKLEALPDLDQTIYVYCRSGNRSKQAAEKLVAIGYTNIIEFGGIIDWTGEIETGTISFNE